VPYTIEIGYLKLSRAFAWSIIESFKLGKLTRQAPARVDADH
jgi:hypothetical protein